MMLRPSTSGLSVDLLLDRVRRDVIRTIDSLQVSRVIGQLRAELRSDNWVDLLSKASASLEMRSFRGEGTLDEAAEWAMPEMPVCLSFKDGDSRRFILIHDHFGGRVLATLGPDPFQSNWISRRELETRLGLERDQRTTWVSFSAATTAIQPDPADKKPRDMVEASQASASARVHAHSDHGHHAGVPPLTRLIQILRPEWKDIRVIMIYALATSVLGLASPLAVEALVATVGFRMLLQQVIVLTVVLFVFLGLAAALFTIQKYVVEVIQRRIFVRIVADFAYRIPRSKVSAFDHHDGPELLNRFFDVMTIQKTLAGLITDGIYLIITTILGLAIMGFYHPFLLGFDIVLLTSISAIIFILGRGGVATSIGESMAKYQTAAWLEELARLPITLKHFAGKSIALERADSVAKSYLDARRSHFRIVYRQVLFATMLQVVASTTLLGLGGWLVIKGQLTLGQLVASELIVTIVVSSFAKFGKYIEDFYDLVTAADKIGHILDLPIETDLGDPLPDTGMPAEVALDNALLKDDHGHVLAGPFTFEIKSGEKAGVTGPSGCGKSMLLTMLAGERLVTNGHVEIDRFNIRDIRPDDLRSQIAFAADEPLMEGSVIDNVRMGRDALSLREVRWALEVVSLDEKFSQSGQGIYKWIGPRGLGLSRGEICRLQIARAIVGSPRLVLIDGHLDGLDRESAERILEVLTAQDASWTLVLVSQSPDILARLQKVITIPAHSHHPEQMALSHH
ncbi:MAG: Alpha-hemolysin translocation ATP-binding protein HlyB [Planctomycetota bacterium]|jgi:putative ABC transport system ATP-binding protein